MKQRKHRSRASALVAAVALAAALLVAATSSAGGLTPPPTDEVVAKVTICHRTNSNANPYVVNEPAADGDVSGHAGHTGPVWNDTLKEDHIKWGDIIPPFKWSGGDYPGLNWTTEGQAFYEAGCVTPPPVEQLYGSISVTKTVVPPTGTPTGVLPTKFTIHVECDGGDTVSTDLDFDYVAGPSAPQTIDNVEAGSECEVTELNTGTFPAGTTVVVSPAGLFPVDANQTVNVAVTNTFDSLEVAPEVVEQAPPTVAAEAVSVAPGFTG